MNPTAVTPKATAERGMLKPIERKSGLLKSLKSLKKNEVSGEDNSSGASPGRNLGKST